MFARARASERDPRGIRRAINFLADRAGPRRANFPLESKNVAGCAASSSLEQHFPRTKADLLLLYVNILLQSLRIVAQDRDKDDEPGGW